MRRQGKIEGYDYMKMTSELDSETGNIIFERVEIDIGMHSFVRRRGNKNTHYQFNWKPRFCPICLLVEHHSMVEVHYGISEGSGIFEILMVGCPVNVGLRIAGNMVN